MKLLSIGGAAGRVAERIDLDAHRGEAERRKIVAEHHQELRVDERIVAPEDLRTDLVELTKAALLRPLTAKHRPEIEELRHRLPPVDPILDVGANYRSRTFGA